MPRVPIRARVRRTSRPSSARRPSGRHPHGSSTITRMGRASSSSRAGRTHRSTRVETSETSRPRNFRPYQRTCEEPSARAALLIRRRFGGSARQREARCSVAAASGGSMPVDHQPAAATVREAVATITGAATSAIGPESGAVIERIIASARRLGVELDAKEAEQWISAVRTEAAGGDISVDVATGVYGHRVTMLDYSPEDLARFREIGKIVGFADRPPDVLTALSISGSAAQGKIQRFPGDCDFFERIHIRAASRADAGRILGDLMREKALATLSGPGYRLWEVKWGTHSKPV